MVLVIDLLQYLPSLICLIYLVIAGGGGGGHQMV
jgi:hypothetical protein